jgi:hypothetical protein
MRRGIRTEGFRLTFAHVVAGDNKRVGASTTKLTEGGVVIESLGAKRCRDDVHDFPTIG